MSDAQPGDSLFLLYSGHGGSQRDGGGDEADGRDEYMCPVDILSGAKILDDELKALLSDNLPEGVRYHTHTFLDI